jgi:hypothetical protein
MILMAFFFSFYDNIVIKYCLMKNSINFAWILCDIIKLINPQIHIKNRYSNPVLPRFWTLMADSNREFQILRIPNQAQFVWFHVKLSTSWGFSSFSGTPSLKIKNSHIKVKIWSCPIYRYGTFSGCKLIYNSKNVHILLFEGQL